MRQKSHPMMSPSSKLRKQSRIFVRNFAKNPMQVVATNVDNSYEYLYLILGFLTPQVAFGLPIPADLPLAANFGIAGGSNSSTLVRNLFWAILLLRVVLPLSEAADALVHEWWRLTRKLDPKTDSQTYEMLALAFRTVLWLFWGLIAIDMLGWDMSLYFRVSGFLGLGLSLCTKTYFDDLVSGFTLHSMWHSIS